MIQLQWQFLADIINPRRQKSCGSMKINLPDANFLILLRQMVAPVKVESLDDVGPPVTSEVILHKEKRKLSYNFLIIIIIKNILRFIQFIK